MALLMSTLPQPSSLSIISSFSSSLTVPLSFSLLADANNDSNSLHPQYSHLPTFTEKNANWNDFAPVTPKPSSLSVTPVSSLFVPSPHTAPINANNNAHSQSGMPCGALTLAPPCTTIRTKSTDVANEDTTRMLLSDPPITASTVSLATPAVVNPRPPSMQQFNGLNLPALKQQQQLQQQLQQQQHHAYTSTSALVMPPSLVALPFLQANQDATAAINGNAIMQFNPMNSPARRDKQLPVKVMDVLSSASGAMNTVLSGASDSHPMSNTNTRMTLDVPSDHANLTPSSSSSMSISLSIPANVQMHVQPFSHFNTTIPRPSITARVPPAQPNNFRSAADSTYSNVGLAENKVSLNPSQMAIPPSATFPYPIPMPMPMPKSLQNSTSVSLPASSQPAPAAALETTRRTSKRKLAALVTSTNTSAPASKPQSTRVSSAQAPRRAQRRRRRSTVATAPPSPAVVSAPVRPRMRMINGRLRAPILSPARLASHRKYDAKRRKIFQNVFSSLRNALVSGQSTLKDIGEGGKRKDKGGKKRKNKDTEKKTAVEVRVNNYSIAELLRESANTIRALTQLKETMQTAAGEQVEEEDEHVQDKKIKKNGKKSKVKKEEPVINTVKNEHGICVADLETLKSVISFLFQSNEFSEGNDEKEDEEDNLGSDNESTDEEEQHSIGEENSLGETDNCVGDSTIVSGTESNVENSDDGEYENVHGNMKAEESEIASDVYDE